MQFNEALNSATAQSITSYALATVAKNKKQKSKPMALSSATYSSSAFTVTLLTRKTLALNPPLALTVVGPLACWAPWAASSTATLGQPGEDFTAVLSRLAPPSPANRRPLVSMRSMPVAAGLQGPLEEENCMSHSHSRSRPGNDVLAGDPVRVDRHWVRRNPF